MGKFNPDRTVLPIPDRIRRRRWAHAAGLRRRLVDDPRRRRRPRARRTCCSCSSTTPATARPTPSAARSARRTSRGCSRWALTYNRFHVTAVCSPTRAALLTGRNQHRVGFGSIAEYPGPFPGYTAAKPRSCAGVPAHPARRTATSPAASASGTSRRTTSRARPVRSTTGRKSWGFDHWWGFLSGAAGQYDPIITQDDSTLGVPEGKDGEPYYFPDDLTDKAVEWLHAVRAQDAHKPWMMYYSTGCAHAPHHVAKEWADKYKGKFDDGWDKLRERDPRAPEGARDRPAGHRADRAPRLLPGVGLAHRRRRRSSTSARWRSTPATRRTPTGTSGGCSTPSRRWATSTTRSIFYIWGDNGASMEGTITGSFNELTFLNGLVLDADQQLELIEKYGGIEALGGDHTAPHFAGGLGARLQHAVPVGQADRQPPRRHPRPDGRGVAEPDQARHGDRARSSPTCIDVGPTILEAAGIPEPKTVDGIAQEPMDGTSFLYSFDDAKAPERHTQQYFEMFGSRGHVQGRLVGGVETRPAPVGRLAGDARPVRPRRRLGPRPRRRLGALRPARRLLAGPRRRRRSTRTRSRSSRSCGGRRPSATGCCRSWAACR